MIRTLSEEHVRAARHAGSVFVDLLNAGYDEATMSTFAMAFMVICSLRFGGPTPDGSMRYLLDRLGEAHNGTYRHLIAAEVAKGGTIQ